MSRRGERDATGPYECKFILNSKDRDKVVKHVESISPNQAISDEFTQHSLVLVQEDTSEEWAMKVVLEKGVMPLGEINEKRYAAVDAAVDEILQKCTRPVGIVDFMSSAAARALKRRQVPYYVTLPGPTSILALAGVKGVAPTVREYLPYLAIRCVPSIVKMMTEFCSTLRETCDPARGIFSSSFMEEPSSWCMPASCPYSDKVHMVHTFSPRWKTFSGLDAFIADMPSIAQFIASGKPIILCSTGTFSSQSLTTYGIRELYKALRRGRESWRVVWKIGHQPIFEEALEIFDDGASRDEWFAAAAWLPQIALLSLPQVQCFISHMGWNGTIEALMSGCPMLSTPIGADQPTNAAFCQRLGVALALDTSDPMVNAMTPPRHASYRPPERFDEDEAYNKLVAILEPNSTYRQAAQRVQKTYFGTGCEEDDESRGIGPGAVVAFIEADLNQASRQN